MSNTAAGENVSPVPYMSQIDTLRMLAVGAVMLDHFMPHVTKRFEFVDGVLFFFVISGYLITRILLSYRDEIEGQRGGLGHAFGVFYARRALRIFPAYYVLCLILIATGLAGEWTWWHLTYTTNIWSALNNAFAAVGGHFWSLGVEEQFYMVWPLVVLAAPRKWLPYTMIGGVVFALVFREVAQAMDWGLARRTLPFGNFEPLMAGALLAWVHVNKQTKAIAFIRRYGLFAFVPLISYWVGPRWLNFNLLPACLTLISVYAIDQCQKGFTGALGAFMSFKPFLFLGKISYGLYLYHYLMARVIGSDSWVFPAPFDQFESFIRTGATTAATIAVATVSWYVLEAPMNRLKDNFQLKRRPRQAPAASMATAPT